jgi:hypothetical protein
MIASRGVRCLDFGDDSSSGRLSYASDRGHEMVHNQIWLEKLAEKSSFVQTIIQAAG